MAQLKSTSITGTLSVTGNIVAPKFVGTVDWGNLNGIPSSFTPSTHSHTKSQITDFPSSMTPTSHATSTTTYGAGTTSNYGHVKISNGDVNTVAAADGLVAGMDHSHSNYLTAETYKGTVTSIATSGAITGGTITSSGTISHSADPGYKHIPSGGSSGQFLKWSANGAAAWASDNDTKNTAGSTDTSSTIYLVGATSQAANPQTYSDNEVKVTSGLLDAKSFRVASKATWQYNSSTDCIELVWA